MAEKPTIWELLRVGLDVDGGLTDIDHLLVQSSDLGIAQRICTLLWMNARVEQNFVCRRVTSSY